MGGEGARAVAVFDLDLWSANRTRDGAADGGFCSWHYKVVEKVDGGVVVVG